MLNLLLSLHEALLFVVAPLHEAFVVDHQVLNLFDSKDDSHFQLIQLLHLLSLEIGNLLLSFSQLLVNHSLAFIHVLLLLLQVANQGLDLSLFFKEVQAFTTQSLDVVYLVLFLVESNDALVFLVIVFLFLLLILSIFVLFVVIVALIVLLLSLRLSSLDVEFLEEGTDHIVLLGAFGAELVETLFDVSLLYLDFIDLLTLVLQLARNRCDTSDNQAALGFGLLKSV